MNLYNVIISFVLNQIKAFSNVRVFYCLVHLTITDHWNSQNINYKPTSLQRISFCLVPWSILSTSKYALGSEGGKMRVCGEKKSLKINDGRSGRLSSYTKNSTLYLYKKVSNTYAFPKHLLENVSSWRQKSHYLGLFHRASGAYTHFLMKTKMFQPNLDFALKIYLVILQLLK